MSGDTGTPGTRASEETAPVCHLHPQREAHIRCQRCERPICPDCMLPASVGFQCPSCVREGAKGTRSARTAYGGERPADPALTSRVLIGLNVAVWVLIMATGGNRSTLVNHLALRPGSTYQGRVYPQFASVAGGEPWQLVTSMFTHVAVWHIAFNMLALWVLGPQLELALGRARFLALYLVSGLAGSAMVMWFSTPYISTLGASGAIFGLMGGLLVIAIKTRGDVRGMLTWIGINVAVTVIFIGNLSWQGHLGGLVGGVVVAAALVYAPRTRRTAWQAAGVGGVALLVALATVLRVAMLA